MNRRWLRADREDIQIEKISEGLVQSWNYANPAQQVSPGDRIVEVNGVSGESTLLGEEIKSQKMVRLRLLRTPKARPEAQRARSWPIGQGWKTWRHTHPGTRLVTRPPPERHEDNRYGHEMAGAVQEVTALKDDLRASRAMELRMETKVMEQSEQLLKHTEFEQVSLRILAERHVRICELSEAVAGGLVRERRLRAWLEEYEEANTHDLEDRLAITDSRVHTVEERIARQEAQQSRAEGRATEAESSCMTLCA